MYRRVWLEHEEAAEWLKYRQRAVSAGCSHDDTLLMSDQHNPSSSWSAVDGGRTT